MHKAHPRQSSAYIIALALCLSGCGRPASYAALLPRPTELGNETPASAGASSLGAAKAMAAIPASPEQLAALDDAVQQAQKGDARFTTALANQRKIIDAARNAPPMSEAWIVAQEGISLLESARTPTAEAETQLDALYLDARANGVAIDTVGQARSKVVTLIARQDAILRATRGSLSQIRTDAH